MARTPHRAVFTYLILDACYLKARWGDRVGDLALLVAVGISEEGYRPGAPTKPLMSVLEVLAAPECCWGTQGSVPGSCSRPYSNAAKDGFAGSVACSWW